MSELIHSIVNGCDLAFPSSCLAYPFLAFTLFHTLPSFHRALLTLDLYSALPHTLSSLHYHALPILALPFALPPTFNNC